jgi:hypothetical protein
MSFVEISLFFLCDLGWATPSVSRHRRLNFVFVFRCSLEPPSGWRWGGRIGPGILFFYHLDWLECWTAGLLQVVAATSPGFGVCAAAVDVPAPTSVCAADAWAYRKSYAILYHATVFPLFWPAGSDSFGSVLVYLYLFHFLKRLAWVLVPFCVWLLLWPAMSQSVVRSVRICHLTVLV